MKSHLTYNDIVKICKQINEKYLPDDEPFAEKVEELFEQYNEEPSLQFILKAFCELLKLVDSEIRQIEQKVNIRPTCAKGCAHCCYFPIITTKLEAKLIKAYIDGLSAKEREDLLNHLRTYFQRNQTMLQKVCALDFTNDVRFKEKYISEQVPCPFLDLKTNMCKVYEVRPIPCRTYLNYGDPNVCAQSYMPNEPFSYEFFYEYYMQALNEVIQEFLDYDEELAFDYPDDLFILDYLPRLFEQELEITS